MIWILAITVVVLLLVLAGVLHFRVSKGRTEITLEHGKVKEKVKEVTEKTVEKAKELVHHDSHTEQKHKETPQ